MIVWVKNLPDELPELQPIYFVHLDSLPWGTKRNRWRLRRNDIRQIRETRIEQSDLKLS